MAREPVGLSFPQLRIYSLGLKDPKRQGVKRLGVQDHSMQVRD